MEHLSALTNVLGEPLDSCCEDCQTGFFRDGYCRTTKHDFGRHVICAVVTQEFLEFSKKQGNDLMTPVPHYNFPGLKSGDTWCVCAIRWKEAYEAGVAPPVKLSSTHQSALDIIPIKILERFSYAVQCSA